MAAQSLFLVKGEGSFVLSGSELSPTTLSGSPYPSSAGTIDFTSHSITEQSMLQAANHPTTPQHSSGHPTVVFLYSTWT